LPRFDAEAGRRYGHNVTVARILVGVTGGIAAYKACELVRLLVRRGHDVTPITTRGAERFVAPETFWALARKTPHADPYPHLESADLLVVAPLTAHTLARLAHGLADDLLTETALAHRGPLLLAPAMNTAMWKHPATQANLAVVVERGAVIVGPEDGELAEGLVGPGRMAEPDEIARRVDALLEGGDGNGALAGKRVLVTAGGTREPLDSVRFLANRSSGRMGVALADAALERGAAVTLLGANLQVPAPDGVEVVSTPTAADLRREALARADVDIVLMAAAVADYRPAEALETKRPKSAAPWTVELVPTTDVARALGASRREGQVLVAFGAESGEDGLARKRAMLTDKNVDLVVYNDVGRDDIGFDSADNEVVLVTRDGERAVAKASKLAVAREILDEVERLLARDA
jgi:phosphopantothenoylcysteine decarboxylase/phosphopantothenate--cysteine ligase